MNGFSKSSKIWNEGHLQLWIFRCHVLEQILKETEVIKMQVSESISGENENLATYLGDTEGLVLDHCNKGTISIKQ